MRELSLVSTGAVSLISFFLCSTLFTPESANFSLFFPILRTQDPSSKLSLCSREEGRRKAQRNKGPIRAGDAMAPLVFLDERKRHSTIELSFFFLLLGNYLALCRGTAPRIGLRRALEAEHGCCTGDVRKKKRENWENLKNENKCFVL